MAAEPEEMFSLCSENICSTAGVDVAGVRLSLFENSFCHSDALRQHAASAEGSPDDQPGKLVVFIKTHPSLHKVVLGVQCQIGSDYFCQFGSFGFLVCLLNNYIDGIP